MAKLKYYYRLDEMMKKHFYVSEETLRKLMIYKGVLGVRTYEDVVIHLLKIADILEQGVELTNLGKIRKMVYKYMLDEYRSYRTVGGDNI